MRMDPATVAGECDKTRPVSVALLGPVAAESYSPFGRFCVHVFISGRSAQLLSVRTVGDMFMHFAPPPTPPHQKKEVIPVVWILIVCARRFSLHFLYQDKWHLVNSHVWREGQNFAEEWLALLFFFFVFERSLVQILTEIPAIVMDIFRRFPQLLLTSAYLKVGAFTSFHSLTSYYSLIVQSFDTDRRYWKRH
jgi:hypothetical protein